jgi:hypothetical protein
MSWMRSFRRVSLRGALVGGVAAAAAMSGVGLYALGNASAQDPPEAFSTPDEGITFAQITDNRPLDLSRSGGRIGFVWAGHSIPGQATGTSYFSQDRDPDRSHTAEWYATHAPDEIVYKCDRKSPAPLFTYPWGYYVPVDTANPAVREYLLNRYLAPARRSANSVIALDNVVLRNNGHRCGVYRNGQWVQLFSGEASDPRFTAAVLDWIAWIAARIHANGGLLAINGKVDPSDEESTKRLIGLADIWLDENAFTRDCKPRASDQEWRVKMEISRWAAARMPWISLEKTCASPADLSEEEAQWVAGNFLLAKGKQSYLAVFHQSDPPRTMLRYPPTLNPPVGTPQGTAFAVPGGGMARRFSRGLVVVNPNSATQLVFSLPPGSWISIGGAAAPAKVVLGPTSAAIFLSRQGAGVKLVGR